jgi:hypothetical protein
MEFEGIEIFRGLEVLIWDFDEDKDFWVDYPACTSHGSSHAYGH